MTSKMKKCAALQYSSVLATVALILCSALPSSAQDKKKPRLVLQITVDQLRDREYLDYAWRCRIGGRCPIEFTDHRGRKPAAAEFQPARNSPASAGDGGSERRPKP
jgi:hypothetical protein